MPDVGIIETIIAASKIAAARSTVSLNLNPAVAGGSPAAASSLFNLGW
jgi:hypothetical protein